MLGGQAEEKNILNEAEEEFNFFISMVYIAK